MDNQLKIITFGRFQISDGARDFMDATSSRSKMWSVLKYLIAFCGKPVPADRLVDVIWADEDHDNPAKLLRDVIYRLRKTLTTYNGEQQYINYSQGNYSWNDKLNCWIDFVEFNELISRARDAGTESGERIALYADAIALYDGPFLRDAAIEIWTLTLTDYYRRLFLQAVDELAELYELEGMLEEIVMLYDKAITCEPYEEPLYIKQIQTLIDTGEYEHARKQYKVIEKVLMREFGTKPSHSLERLSYEIDKATMTQAGSLDEISQLLEEGSRKQGAMFCGPETFRQIYMLDKRSDERINFPVYLALMTYMPHTDIDEIKAENELRNAMRILRQVLRQSLRNGDVIAQYSRNQFVLMITAIDEKSGSAALRRMKYLFENKFGPGVGELEYHLSPIGKGDIGLVSDKDDERRMKV